MLLQTSFNKYYMRFLPLLILSLSTSFAFGQKVEYGKNIASGNENNIYSLTPSYVNSSLELSWPVQDADRKATWEIQACEKGHAFKTIGLVWGVQEESAKCKFKQQLKKMATHYDEYRVVKYDGLVTTNN